MHIVTPRTVKPSIKNLSAMRRFILFLSSIVTIGACIGYFTLWPMYKIELGDTKHINFIELSYLLFVILMGAVTMLVAGGKSGFSSKNMPISWNNSEKSHRK